VDAGDWPRAAAHQIFVIPTLSILEYVCNVASGDLLSAHPALSPYLSAADKAQLHSPMSFQNAAYRAAEEVVRQLKAAGVPLLAGTDAALNTVHGASLHRELELLVGAGLTPLEALASATSQPARLFDLPDRGRFAPGLRADLLLVEGDPTTDILATRSIVGVWKQGIEVDRQGYRRQLMQQELDTVIRRE
jgi:cytosine/adenosine deaminase-related metal-dependent hydrolase